MAAVLIGRFTPGSAEWHAARAGGIAGSEIAAVLGLSPWESRFSLYHRKAGVIGEAEETPQMEWGTRLEPAIVGKFLDEHPEYVDPGEAGTWRHVDRPWQVANPDRLLAPSRGHDVNALLETKFSLFGDGWGDAGTDHVPPHVRCQVLWYLDTLDLQVGHVAVLIGGHDYREYVVERDEAECAELRSDRWRRVASEPFYNVADHPVGPASEGTAR